MNHATEIMTSQPDRRRTNSENSRDAAESQQSESPAEIIRRVSRIVARHAIDSYWQAQAIELDVYRATKDIIDDDDKTVSDRAETWMGIACKLSSDAERALAKSVLVWEAEDAGYDTRDLRKQMPTVALVDKGAIYIVAADPNIVGIDSMGHVHHKDDGAVMRLHVVDLANVHRIDGEAGL